MKSPPSSIASAPFLVACLCARWCDLCGQYAAVFSAAEAAAGERACFVWVDIEDEEALLGPLDVENFPTLLIAGREAPLFYGPLTPQPGTLARVLKSAMDGELRRLDDAELAQLVNRVRAAAPRLKSAGD